MFGQSHPDALAMRRNGATRIFAFWTGDNPMSPLRQRCWESFPITGLEPTLITPATLPDWVVPNHPLHPAYDLLSPVHRSDYLRAYFMFHHGGGYADVKQQTASWLSTVQRVNRSRVLIGAGYREVRGNTTWLQLNPIGGRARVLGWLPPPPVVRAVTNALRTMRPLLIGNGALYFKPRTGYARRWLREVERRLDELQPVLRQHPAREPRDRAEYGTGYPIPWTYLLADITQPLMLAYFPRVLRSLPAPLLVDYEESLQRSTDPVESPPSYRAKLLGAVRHRLQR